MVGKVQQDISDIKGSGVDIFRDTALRYLGEYCIHYKGVMIILRPTVDSFLALISLLQN